MEANETDLLAPCYQPDDDDLVPLHAEPFAEWLCQLFQGR